jgi:hypothetical protein
VAESLYSARRTRRPRFGSPIADIKAATSGEKTIEGGSLSCDPDCADIGFGKFSSISTDASQEQRG